MIRQPAVAGMFYPANKSELQSAISHYMEGSMCTDEIRPKAIIVPHAGYVYSAEIAASAYQLIKPFRESIHRVVLIGPSHRVAFRGIAYPESDIFETPLGKIDIDKELAESISALPQVVRSEQAHIAEHSLEVQLPFLQSILDRFTLLPLVAGEVERHQVAEVLKHVWGDEHTLIVISSDLSHYHQYDHAKRLDQETSDAIEHFLYDEIGYENACGRNGVLGLMTVAEDKGMKLQTIDLRNSGDTAGDKTRVVGYGAYACY